MFVPSASWQILDIKKKKNSGREVVDVQMDDEILDIKKKEVWERSWGRADG